MRIKKAKLEGYAMYIDFNTDKVEFFNIFHVICPCAKNGDSKYSRGENAIAKVIRNKTVTNRDELKAKLNSGFMNMYWSRCEGEMVVLPGPYGRKKDGEKIDVYDQLFLNLDRITDYVIAEMNIKFK